MSSSNGSMSVAQALANLGLPRNATFEQAKDARRAMLLVTHPHKSKSAETAAALQLTHDGDVLRDRTIYSWPRKFRSDKTTRKGYLEVDYGVSDLHSMEWSIYNKSAGRTYPKETTANYVNGL